MPRTKNIVVLARSIERRKRSWKNHPLAFNSLCSRQFHNDALMAAFRTCHAPSGADDVRGMDVDLKAFALRTFQLAGFVAHGFFLNTAGGSISPASLKNIRASLAARRKGLSTWSVLARLTMNTLAMATHLL